VVVAAPTPLHAEASLAAIKAGKHVLCEMPLASNLDAADQIIEAADKQGVLLMPGLTFRFTPSFVKAKETMVRGELGAPVAFSYREFIPARDLANQWPPGAWVWNVAESGGPLYTLSVWSIDLVRWLFDTEVAEVWGAAKYSRLAKFEGTVGYDASATLKLANGVVGCLQYSGSVASSASTCALEVIGDTTRVLRADENHSLTLFGEEPVETKWNVKESGARMWGHVQQDEHFISCIRDGQKPQITPTDGRKAMEIALKIGQP
jgi:predicted dehydrogenase